MRLVDVNLLMYAYDADSPHHALAGPWLNQRLAGHERLGLPWETLLAFVRLGSNPRVFERSRPVAELWIQVQEWLSAAPVWVPVATESHEQVLATLVPATTSHRLVHDAHLAALAIEHGLILCTADRGFARFPGLRWENPLEVTA